MERTIRVNLREGQVDTAPTKVEGPLVTWPCVEWQGMKIPVICEGGPAEVKGQLARNDAAPDQLVLKVLSLGAITLEKKQGTG